MGMIWYIAYFFFSSVFSSSFGSGPGVGNLNVSGLSIRPRRQLRIKTEIPSPKDSHGVEVSKLRKAAINGVHPWAYLESSLMVQLLPVPSPHHNELPCILLKENPSSTDTKYQPHNLKFVVYPLKPIIRKNPSQIRMSNKEHSIHIIHFPLIPIPSQHTQKSGSTNLLPRITAQLMVLG